MKKLLKEEFLSPKHLNVIILKNFQIRVDLRLSTLGTIFFLNIKDPKKLYPFGLPGGHYNKFGYKIIVEHILENYFNE